MYTFSYKTFVSKKKNRNKLEEKLEFVAQNREVRILSLYLPLSLISKVAEVFRPHTETLLEFSSTLNPSSSFHHTHFKPLSSKIKTETGSCLVKCDAFTDGNKYNERYVIFVITVL